MINWNNPLEIVPASLPKSDHPSFWYGIIASGNELMESAAERDRIGHEFGALCVWTVFNSEAAIVLRTDR
jgi:hypothetical protein